MPPENRLERLALADREVRGEQFAPRLPGRISLKQVGCFCCRRSSLECLIESPTSTLVRARAAGLPSLRGSLHHQCTAVVAECTQFRRPPRFHALARNTPSGDSTDTSCLFGQDSLRNEVLSSFCRKADGNVYVSIHECGLVGYPRTLWIRLPFSSRLCLATHFGVSQSWNLLRHTSSVCTQNIQNASIQLPRMGSCNCSQCVLLHRNKKS